MGLHLAAHLLAVLFLPSLEPSPSVRGMEAHTDGSFAQWYVIGQTDWNVNTVQHIDLRSCDSVLPTAQGAYMA